MEPRLPQHLHEAYDWVDAAGEIDILARLGGDELEAYATDAAVNADVHDVRVVHSDIVTLAAWLREHGG